MQPGYLTPIKNIQHSYQRKLFNSDSIHREGDWVCINCQNLNYSFRKKCNRCKTQSRVENEAHSVYSYYYYPKVDQPINFSATEHLPTERYPCRSFGEDSGQKSQREDNFTFPEDNKQNVEKNEWPVSALETPKKKRPQVQCNDTKLDGLPSVSPLIKKYRRNQHHTTIEKLRNTTLLDSSPLNNKQFETIKIRDFDKLIQELGGKEVQGEGLQYDKNQQEDLCGVNFMKEIEDSIARIII